MFSGDVESDLLDVSGMDRFGRPVISEVLKLFLRGLFVDAGRGLFDL